MEQRQAIADRLKQSNNILVTVSSNPSVDQLASCIGLTLALNKMGKHATAVFSGSVPSTLEFLQPEKTLEKNTDSLRDFIIALDKAKADKLRYKVEDKVVKIFITPYKTSISDKDLDFSQGDFNVDVVVALGVHQQNELDQAITAHGRILHDAVVATVNTKPGGELGTINWLDNTASSLSELTVQLLDVIDKEIMDGQMATAFLTGIVAETNRFSNERTTPQVMSISAELMGHGANQQLVATKLEEPAAPPPPPPASPVHEQGASLQGDAGKPEEHHADDGTLEITHAARDGDQPAPTEEHHDGDHEHEEQPEPQLSQIHIDEHGALQNVEPLEEHKDEASGNTDPTGHMASSRMILQPPANSGGMSAVGMSDDESSADPLSLPQPDGGGFGSPSGFGPSPASANIAPPEMPYLPPSMTPGGTITPANPAPPPTPPAPEPAPQPIVAPAAPEAPAQTPLVPPPAPQIIHPGADPLSAPAPSPAAAPAPSPLFPVPDTSTSTPVQPPAPSGETLSQIEADVHSPHVQTSDASALVPPTVAPPIQPPAPDPMQPASVFAPAQTPPAPEPAAPAPQAPAADAISPDLASARDAVLQAIAGQPGQSAAPEPIQALNAQPLGDPLHEAQPAPAPQAPAAPMPTANLDATANPTFTLPDIAPAAGPAPGTTPPAMPPPMMPPGGFGQ
jgi:hypothetical protein